MKYIELKEYINSDSINESLAKIICDNDVLNEKKRYLDLLEKAYRTFGDGDYHFISSPGRSEVGGNHTDHQHGHVIACSLNIDNLAIVKKNNTDIVNYIYDNNSNIKVDLSNLQINKDEYNTSNSLIRGIGARLIELGHTIGGFDAICDSRVLVGSGISSSACFEVMIVEIFNALFNNETINDIDRAIISQYAENVYFGKPSGLMDQMAISVGSFISIDFKNPNKPIIEKYPFSFSDYGYEFVLINTKGDHADLSHEYAAITSEIKSVAKQLGVEYLADSSIDKLLNNLSDIRKTVNNDRAVLRSLHFFKEDERAIKQKDAIKNLDIQSLLKLMRESGKSSYEYLQNVYPASRPSSQSLAIGLFLADCFIKDDGAYRVHGGGFDGTIQVIVKKEKLSEFRKVIESTFGLDSMMVVKVRQFGTKLVI